MTKEPEYRKRIRERLSSLQEQPKPKKPRKKRRASPHRKKMETT